MNKLIFPNGGMPFELDDLDFMQEATKDGIKGLLHEFASKNSGNLILSGCKVSPNGSNFDISAGYVMLDYEVLSFVGATNIATSQPYFELDVSYDPAGNDVFFDNVSRDTYEVRKATHNTSVPAGTNVQLLDSNRLTSLMKLSLLQPDVDWGQAYYDDSTKTLDLTKDTAGAPFANPEENYSKKYIYAKVSGGKVVDKIHPYPADNIAKSYVIVPSTGELRFSVSGTFLVADSTTVGPIVIKQNESIEIVSTRGIHNGGGGVQFDTWRIKNGGAATLNKVNSFARTQKEAKSTTTWNGVAVGTLSLNLDGNTFDVDTSAQHTINYVLSLGVGTKIHLTASDLPFLINHKTGSVPSGYKAIVLPDGKTLECGSKNATISLIEHDTHWRVQGTDKRPEWKIIVLPDTDATATNMSISTGSVRYVKLGAGLVLFSFSFIATVGTGAPNTLSLSIAGVDIAAITYSTCNLSASSSGEFSGETIAADSSNSIEIKRIGGASFSSGETVDISGQIVMNADIV